VAPSVQRRKVWLTPTSTVPCSNAATTRNPLKFAGVTQTRQQISAAKRPKFTILWGHMGEILLLNNFSDCRYMSQLRKYSPTKLCDGAQMAFFVSFLRPAFPSGIHAAGSPRAGLDILAVINQSRPELGRLRLLRRTAAQQTSPCFARHLQKQRKVEEK